MSPQSFQAWLEELQARGLIRAGHGAHSDAARLLGVTYGQVVKFIKHGTIQQQTDLACAAVLRKLKPYGSTGDN